MGKLYSTAAAVALAATLAACGSQAAAPPTPMPSPTHSSTAPSPTASTLTPPVMPEAAKAHTKAGAKAFVVYYWQAVDYAQTTLDVAPLRAISSSGCTGCQGGIKALEHIRRAGGHIDGGGESASVRSVSPINQGAMFVSVRLTLRTRQLVIVPGKPTHAYEPGSSHASVIVSPVEGGWVMSELRY